MLLAALVAFVCTLGLVPVAMVALRRVGVFDHPTRRSSHSRPVLRGGGIAPAVGMLVALAATAAVPGWARPPLAVAAVAFGAIGLADDLRELDVFLRLVLQAGVASAVALPVVGLLDWPAWSAVVVVLWLVAFVNAFNFMDGINGISCACTIVTGAVWWVVGDAVGVDVLAGGGVVTAAAGLGFAPVNVLDARMFLGDVGSYFLGAWLAVLAVLGLGEGVPPEAVIAPLVLYLADTGTTLVRRIARGERWHQAHADHAYQRLVQAGWSHASTTVLVGGLMALTGALGVLTLAQSAVLRATADLAIVTVVAGYLWLAGRVTAQRTRSATVAG